MNRSTEELRSSVAEETGLSQESVSVRLIPLLSVFIHYIITVTILQHASAASTTAVTNNGQVLLEAVTDHGQVQQLTIYAHAARPWSVTAAWST